MKKKILIIFPYGNLGYSPTTTNLCKLLGARGHHVKVVYGFQAPWVNQSPRLDGIELENIFYTDRTMWFATRVDKYFWRPIVTFMQKLPVSGVYARLSLRDLLFSHIIKKALRTNKCDELIVVDILPLFWAQRLRLDCHCVSLEVDDGNHLLSLIDTSKIRSVVIQSPERFERLFGDSHVRHFFIQNAPNFVEPTRRTKASANLIYNGTAWAPFGALDLIEFVKNYPEYRIHFKGSIQPHLRSLVESRYEGLMKSGALSFSATYLEDEALREYFADFSIGFCLYDFNNPFIAQRRFNYETAPSGKVFLYLSVGMPVVATRIPGFRFFEERQAGVLIDDHKPETIRKAVDTILKNYKMFSDNALAIGKSFSFEKSAAPFVDFISQ